MLHLVCSHCSSNGSSYNNPAQASSASSHSSALTMHVVVPVSPVVITTTSSSHSDGGHTAGHGVPATAAPQATSALLHPVEPPPALANGLQEPEDFRANGGEDVVAPAEHVVVGQEEHGDMSDAAGAVYRRLEEAAGAIEITEKQVARLGYDSSSGADEGRPLVTIVRTGPSVDDLHVHLDNSDEAAAVLQQLGERLRRLLHERSSHGTENQWTLLAYPEPFPEDASSLDRGALEAWMRRLKVTAKVLSLMWPKSDVCRDIREFFPEVAEQYKQILLDVASSFIIGTTWTSERIQHMLAIFDTIADALFSTRHLYSSASESSRLAGIFHGMKNAVRRILVRTPYDISGLTESGIHPSTPVLIQALEFFHHRWVQLEVILGPGNDAATNLCNAWISKLEEDAKEIATNEPDRQYIFIVNNTYCVRKIPDGSLSAEERCRFDSLKQQYIDIYLDGYWRPLVERQTLRMTSRSSLKNFETNFKITCDHQRTKRVPAGPREELQGKIIKSIVPLYHACYTAVQNNRSLFGRLRFLPKSRTKLLTVMDVEEEIMNLYSMD
ncbi:hypothetical protein ACP4OV_010269 [Aristida adscensionis]